MPSGESQDATSFEHARRAAHGFCRKSEVIGHIGPLHRHSDLRVASLPRRPRVLLEETDEHRQPSDCVAAADDDGVMLGFAQLVDDLAQKLILELRIAAQQPSERIDLNAIQDSRSNRLGAAHVDPVFGQAAAPRPLQRQSGGRRKRLRGKFARRSDERLYCGFAEVAPRSTAGRPALQGREPGQVRKEAATAIHCKCRGNGSPPLLFVVQIDLILCCSPAPTLTYVHVRSALSPVRAASQADLVTNSRRFDLRPA